MAITLSRILAPITDAVYGTRPKAAPVERPRRANPRARHYSLVRELIDPITLEKLQALRNSLEAEDDE
jgi:hypothetical protein